jgi:Leucine-rich repeat (LRR) protein/GTPase SAR1 family protein
MTESELLTLIELAKQEQWEELDLSGQYLTGLPAALGQLDQLKVLRLGYNDKTRRHNYLTTLPDTLANLRRLQTLDLSRNHLTTLPEWLGQLTNLQSLYLNGLKLSTLPEWLGQLTNLQTLYLSYTNLSILPEWLGQLTNLQTLHLSYTNLSTLPPWLGRLTNLHSLHLNYNKLNTLPEWLGQLTNLQSLDVSYNNINTLPKSLGQLAKLHALHLCDNHFTILPGWLGQLTTLQSLDLRHNNFNTLPEWLGELTNLQSLDLRDNNLSTLPEWSGLVNLTSLYLSYNKFNPLPAWLKQLTGLHSLHLRATNANTLPEWLGQLTELQCLDLSSNNLSTLPDWLAQLHHLQTLHLSYNNLRTLPPWLGQLTNLRSLQLKANKINTLPDWLGQLTNLQSFSFGGDILNRSDLSQLPEWLGQWTHLQSLHLRYNKLNTLPEWLGQLTNLQSLDLSSNNLTTLPDWSGNLTNLQSLDLSYNKLTRLSPWLRQLTGLQSLDLSSNNLHTLPQWLEELTHLQSLDLRYNKLSKLPEWQGKLTNLQSLHLNSNNLSTLPEAIVNLPQLQWLALHENPISEPSPEMFGDALTSYGPVDLGALRRYYAQLHEAGEAIFYEAKLLIIGEGGAGKTSLARKLRAPTSDLRAEEDSTEGIDIFTWQFDLPPDKAQGRYHVNIWDFGGQAVYFATHQFFLTKHSVYILVTDTRHQHTDFYTWLKMQETLGVDSPVLLIKNRNRRHGNFFTIENLPQLRERFPNLKEVFELDLNYVPHEEAWPRLLRELEHRFLSLEHVGKSHPRTWVNMRRVLSKDRRETLSLQQFLQLCYEQGIRRQEDALQLSDYLHHLGDILHFQQDAVLDDIIILKPAWVLDAVYQVLDNEDIVNNYGRFTYDDLYFLWHEARYAGHHHQLLRLMQNFQLCYLLPDQADTFIAPQLLSDDNIPSYKWDSTDNLQLRFCYPVFMPYGILSRAIVKLHHRIEKQNLVWRSGVILNDGYARAELLELRSESEIRIRISGYNKRDLLMEVVRALDDLHQGFPRLHYGKHIPCICSTCQALDNPHFFALEELRQRLANRKGTIECKNPPYEDVPIRSFLDDVTTLTREQPLDRDTIFNIIYGDYVAEGGKQMSEGDLITVGNIAGSSGLSIGREAQARVESRSATLPSFKELEMSKRDLERIKRTESDSRLRHLVGQLPFIGKLFHGDKSQPPDRV